MREAYLRHRIGEALDRFAEETSPARKRHAACWAAARCRALHVENWSAEQGGQDRDRRRRGSSEETVELRTQLAGRVEAVKPRRPTAVRSSASQHAGRAALKRSQCANFMGPKVVACALVERVTKSDGAATQA